MTKTYLDVIDSHANKIAQHAKDKQITAKDVQYMGFDALYSFLSGALATVHTPDVDNLVLYKLGEVESSDDLTFRSMRRLVGYILEDAEAESAPYIDSESHQMAVLQAQAGWHKVESRMSLN